jgi:phosphoribosylanthranilate isomerase
VKVCCITSPGEAQRAVAHGASALGVVSAMPSGPGVISDETCASICASVAPGVETFLLTSLTDADALVAQHQRVRSSVLQLVDIMAVSALCALRYALPTVRLVQVVHVRDARAVHEACYYAPWVDALLLDSGCPEAQELGGTGRTHDWNIAREIVRTVTKPVFLAGGLRVDNVAEARTRVGSFGLDVCSGVRSRGVLDNVRLADFMRAAEARPRLCDAWGPRPNRRIAHARLEDVRAIAEVHVLAWRWAYAGLLPDAVLSTLAVEERAAQRVKALSEPGTARREWCLFEGERVIGFASSGPSRDQDAQPDTGELQALYQHPEVVGTGVGEALLTHTLRDLAARGFVRATLWVLRDNARGRRAYERNGWTFDGTTSDDMVKGHHAPHLRYARSLR